MAKAKKMAASGPIDGPWALPDGWRWERLEAVGRWGSGGTPNVKELVYYGGDIPWFRSGELVDRPLGESEITITEEGLRRSSAKLIEPGAVLVAMYGATVGKLAISTRTCATNQAVAFCSPDPDKITARYLFYYLLSIRQELRSQAQGGAQPNISQSVLKAQAVPVPALELQTSIVARIDELFAEIDDGEAALARAREDLGTWRKAMLKAAVTGELTADWRAANPPTNTGADLLAGILSDRHARWGSEPKNKGKRYAEVLRAEPVGTIELPDEWSWSQMQDLVRDEPHSLTDGPFGSNLKSSHYESSGPRVIRLQNISKTGDFVNAFAHISETHFASLAKHHVAAGDLVVAILGEPVPRAIIVPDHVGPALVKADCFKLRLHAQVNRDFVWAWLNSLPLHAHFEHEVRGVGRPRLGMADVRTMSVPLPPRAEQLEISRQLKEGLLTAIESATDIDELAAAAATLRQSILAAAFRGELA